MHCIMICTVILYDNRGNTIQVAVLPQLALLLLLEPRCMGSLCHRALQLILFVVE